MKTQNTRYNIPCIIDVYPLNIDFNNIIIETDWLDVSLLIWTPVETLTIYDLQYMVYANGRIN